VLYLPGKLNLLHLLPITLFCSCKCLALAKAKANDKTQGSREKETSGNQWVLFG
jgi:hypothetical protein